jgi:hypothetical protein
VDSDEGEDSNEDEDEEDEDDNANQPPLEISISLTLFLTSSGSFAVRKLLAVTRPTNRSILCLGLDSEDRCIRGLLTYTAQVLGVSNAYTKSCVCASWEPS